MEFFNKFIEWADKFTILVSCITLFLVFINYFRDKKLQKDIHIILEHKGEREELIQTLRRMHCSRSEISGLLGSVYKSNRYSPSEKKSPNYIIPFLVGKEFSERLKKVQSGDSEELVIEVEDINEFKIFQDVLKEERKKYKN